MSEIDYILDIIADEIRAVFRLRELLFVDASTLRFKIPNCKLYRSVERKRISVCLRRACFKRIVAEFSDNINQLTSARYTYVVSSVELEINFARGFGE